MKLNFWQILGLVLLVVAALMIYKRETTPSNTAPTNAATQPTK